jgi:hypothetical protein
MQVFQAIVFSAVFLVAIIILCMYIPPTPMLLVSYVLTAVTFASITLGFVMSSCTLYEWLTTRSGQNLAPMKPNSKDNWQKTLIFALGWWCAAGVSYGLILLITWLANKGS